MNECMCGHACVYVCVCANIEHKQMLYIANIQMFIHFCIANDYKKALRYKRVTL